MLLGELEHLKIKMRLIDGKFASVMGECVFVKLHARHLNLELVIDVARTTVTGWERGRREDPVSIWRGA